MSASSNAVSFTESALGFSLNSGGERIYLVNSNQTRVIDAIEFEGQAQGISAGRYPDGGASFYTLANPTPGARNAGLYQWPVVINELMYHPATNEPTMEWLELYNQMAVDVDMSGWSLDGDIHYAFAPGTVLHGGAFLVVAISPTNLAAATGLTNVLGPFSNRLSNGGGQLKLKNNNGRVVNEVDYDAAGDWPVAPDGAGVSLAKIDHGTASAPAENWTFSAQMGGTPGRENFPTGVTRLPLAFNEISSSMKTNFWVELLNYGTNTLSLGGYVILRDSPTNAEYVLPPTTLTAGHFLTLSNTTLGFHAEDGDKLYLLPPGAGPAGDPAGDESGRILAPAHPP
jgi:hypothetical protein